MQHLDARKVVNEYEEEHLVIFSTTMADKRSQKTSEKKLFTLGNTKEIVTTEDLKKSLVIFPQFKPE